MSRTYRGEVVGQKVEEYRRHAEQADKQAAEAIDPVAVQSYRDIGTKWRQLSEQAEKHGW